jgi:hypothetical protein
MKTTHNVALKFHPIFISLNPLFGAILEFGFWIADLLYRFALSFCIFPFVHGSQAAPELIRIPSFYFFPLTS